MTRMAPPQHGQSAGSKAGRDGRAAPWMLASWSLVRLLAVAAMAWRMKTSLERLWPLARKPKWRMR